MRQTRSGVVFLPYEVHSQEDAIKIGRSIEAWSAATTSPVTSPPQSLPRTRKQVGHTKRRANKRKEQEKNPSRPKIRSSQSKQYQNTYVFKTQFNIRALPFTRAGFIGKRFEVTAEHYTLQDYIDEGFGVVKWDGRNTLGLVDTEDLLFGVLVGPPAGDKTWPSVVMEVERCMARAKHYLRFKKKQDRQGRFMTIAAGLSYGGGQMPGVLCHSKHNNKVIRELMENPP
ncbi:hypothetical protein BC835DRAFT_1424521 [Cytidiella melzeri]|nr:hypothetical protein BC835DRAFT_1424521 [Cytidiella melzeri]